MKLNPEQITAICTAFQQMEKPADLVRLLNEVSAFLYGENKRTKLELKQLTRYSIPDSFQGSKHKQYYAFTIPKKSGKPRTIHAPVKGLKRIQKLLNVVLQSVYQPHKAATGFALGKSVVDNARLHAGRRFVYNIDLKDFFPSIDQARIWGRFQHPPFNLAGNNNKTKIASLIAGLCSHSVDAAFRKEADTYDHNIREVWLEKILAGLERKAAKEGTQPISIQKIKAFLANRLENPICLVLPQGAPTSPIISNIICERLDRQLTGLAKRFRLIYSRYADDITFSSFQDVYSIDGPFLKELHRIIKSQNFCINEAKTRLQRPGSRQEVTGLTVNEKPNVPSQYIKQLRCWLRLWETYGEARAQVLFLKDYFDPKRGTGRAEAPSIGNVIGGKLLYLKMVRGADDPRYRKLLSRFEALSGELPHRKSLHISEEINSLGKNEKQAPTSPDDSGVSVVEEGRESHIEKAKLVIENTSETSVMGKPEKNLDRPHRPRDVADVMHEFFKNESTFKYFTHKPPQDQFFRYTDFIASRKVLFHEMFLVSKDEHGNTIRAAKKIPPSLWALLNGFMFSEKGWKISGSKPDEANKEMPVDDQLGWSSMGFKSLYAPFQQKGIHPMEAALTNSKKAAILGDAISGFVKAVRIKRRDLPSFINNTIEAYVGAAQFEALKSDLKMGRCNEAEIFTNVDYFRDALSQMLFYPLKERKSEFPELRFDYKSNNSGRYWERTLYVTNTGSHSEKPIDEFSASFRGTAGDMHELKKTLYGICNWSIINKWPEGIKELKVLHDDTIQGGTNCVVADYEDNYLIDGFTHKLTFFFSPTGDPNLFKS